MPCGSEAWKFVWWATGDNGGRSTHDFFTRVGCLDLRAYDTVPYKDWRGACWDDYYWTYIRSNTQGVPEQLRGAKIISNARNPYAKVISNFADKNLEHYHATGQDLEFKKWVFNTYKDGFNAVDRFPWLEWGKEPHQPEWHKPRPTSHAVIPLPHPDYTLRVEHLEEDIMKIPEIINNTTPELLQSAIKTAFKIDEYSENRRKLHYNKDGTLDWERHYDQELADFVYEGTKIGFEFCGYTKDSWKIQG